ncbi:ferredoxin-NADP reductase [Deinococcus irradiatisoli]|uniref:Ferredoxin--NADP reductase n=1 Tax=Deinococcus irradiatisoli TaxID=2202254 RepID=A0A2Z3JK28_9DEIO|nr:NAD(P)/FAD-dependent oxidoreductase [Deinococcus irradiatisoli]AWN23670.1 ferredoxin-NADP reductase [Deinococcus irradiatisoli]
MKARHASSEVLVIGAGPAGLYAAFYAGLRGLSVRLIDAQPEPGGQLSALYPDKVVYDVPGLPATRAAEIVDALVRQLAPFRPDYRLGEVARDLRRTPDGWTVGTDQAEYPAGAVIVAAGLGALLPREVRLPGLHPDVRTALPDPAAFSGRRVLVVGGVPQATRAALTLAGTGAAVTLTHRRALFRGSPEQLEQVQTLRNSGALQVHAPAELDRLDERGAWLKLGGDRQHVPADTVLVFNGFLPDLGPLQGWPLNWQGEYLPADEQQMTALPGVFVAGDVSLSGGDFKLISVGLALAALAANAAAHFVRPELKIRPGHSSDRRLPPH